MLDVIRAAGTISRVGLARATGFTGATISTVVRRLIDDGLVVETGRAESTGGKPRVLLRLAQDARYAVGVHLDPVGITHVLTDLTGAVVSRMTSAGVGTEDASVVVERTARQVDVLVEGAGIDRDRVLGVGVVSATHGSHTSEPAMRYWGDYPIGTELREAVGLPVVLGNDATAAAIGEYWSGVVGGSSVFAAVYMGTGVGAGLLIDGVPYLGSSGHAGEIGHVCVDVDGPPCWCGARGCVEAVAGPAAVVARARADADLARAAGLDRGVDGPLPSVAAEFTAVVRAARRGEPTARVLLDRSARRLAVAVRGLANVMDLDLLVLTGTSLSAAGPVYLPAIRRELDQAFSARGTHGVEVRMSSSAETAPAIGAATMVLQSQLVPLRAGRRWPEDLSEAVPAHT
ncbi:ROK family protein [Nocardiopsis aegyptia]|uniref:ROK family transcriptional regulator n=1 Tax=Nocardiopsis aegyptia TaxID=220378 RepID=UPI003670AE8F